MTLLLLLRPHRYGAVVTPAKGYAVASDASSSGAGAFNAAAFGSKASDA